MLKPSVFILVSLAWANPAFAELQIPLLNVKACNAQIDADLLAKYASQPYQYGGGGFLTNVKATGNVYSIVGFTTPGMNSDAEDEVVVFNKDCKVLSSTTIWTD